MIKDKHWRFCVRNYSNKNFKKKNKEICFSILFYKNKSLRTMVNKKGTKSFEKTK
jgi:hypothetical protein